MTSQLNQILSNMWMDYCQMNPAAQKIYNLLTEKGETVLNDHIALRTFNLPGVRIHDLAAPFVKLGYQEMGEYFFEQKKLYARHWQHPDNQFPKIFISELQVEKMSDFTQKTIQNLVAQIPQQSQLKDNFTYSGRHWKISYETYEKLADESEYASWMSAWGFRPNHFTVNINALKNFKDIQGLNSFLKQNGFTLNSSGGEVKGTPAELLEQSSTMAEEVSVAFTDGLHKVPGCYYEFAKRYADENGKMYHGFIAKSADKIFESTHRKK